MQRTLKWRPVRLGASRRINWRLLGRRIVSALVLLSTLAALVWLMTGCSSVSQPSTPAVCPTIPPLPPEARQPAPPPICVPTCSEGLRRLLETLLPPQTDSTEQGSRPKTATP